MKIGIVGRPHVGKTTVFNALAHSSAEIGGYVNKQHINQSTVSVADERLKPLADIFQSKEIKSATIDYLDGGGTSRTARQQDAGQVLSAELDTNVLAELRTVDALAHVVRLFEDETVPHVDGSVDAERDIVSINLEFIFADLTVIEGRLARLEKQLKNQNTPENQNEYKILGECKQKLDDGIPLRTLSFSENEKKLIRGYGFLTQKPLLLIINISENQLQQSDEIFQHFASYQTHKQTTVFVLAAQLEMEIAQLDASDVFVFMEEMGLKQSAMERFIQASYELLGLVTFFTGGPKETRARTLRRGQTAVEAAGMIHTDFASGFIRAECINWEDLVNCGSYTEAKSKGLLKTEGKTYQVQEGDVLNILANTTS